MNIEDLAYDDWQHDKFDPDEMTMEYLENLKKDGKDSYPVFQLKNRKFRIQENEGSKGQKGQKMN